MCTDGSTPASFSIRLGSPGGLSCRGLLERVEDLVLLCNVFAAVGFLSPGKPRQPPLWNPSPASCGFLNDEQNLQMRECM
jgi:hypothetical protein